MAKFEPWKPNISGDPDYPWHSCRNEAGGFTYWIPLECPNEIPADDSDDAEKHIYSWLPLFGGKGMMVCWKKTASREWAYDQKRWIDAEARRDQRRPKRETLVAEVLGDGSNDGNHKKEWKLLDGSADDEPTDAILVQRKFGDEAEDKMKNQRRTGEEGKHALDAATEKWELIDVTDERKDATPEAGAKRRKKCCLANGHRAPGRGRTENFDLFVGDRKGSH